MAARAEEILTLNVEDLDLELRRAHVTSKGGATAQLLPRLLADRTCGPVFLADKRGRLSQPRAEYLFKTTSAKLDPHRQEWTLYHSSATRPFSILPKRGAARPNRKPRPATST
jgi:hypothetical protein